MNYILPTIAILGPGLIVAILLFRGHENMPAGLKKTALFLVYWFICSGPVALVLVLVCAILADPLSDSEYRLPYLLSLPIMFVAGVYLWWCGWGKDARLRKACRPYIPYRGHTITVGTCLCDDGSGRNSWVPIIDGVTVPEGAGDYNQVVKWAKAYIRTGSHTLR